MKPYYYSLSEYLKETYGCKMYKLSLSGGMTCPNRDGRIDTRAVFFAVQAVPVIFRRGTDWKQCLFTCRRHCDTAAY